MVPEEVGMVHPSRPTCNNEDMGARNGKGHLHMEVPCNKRIGGILKALHPFTVVEERLLGTLRRGCLYQILTN